MAAMKFDDHLQDNLGTISPTDLEVLDIFNFNCGSNSCVQTNFTEKPVQPTIMGYPQRSLDEELIQATMTVLKTGKLTPLIKQELKCTIQNRRLARGEEEINLKTCMSPPTPSQPVSPEEEASLEEKRRTRRERNRIAALKSRRKKRQEMSGLVEQCEMLEKRNEQLKETLSQMELERNSILEALGKANVLQADVGGAYCSELIGGVTDVTTWEIDSSSETMAMHQVSYPLSDDHVIAAFSP